MAFQLLISTYMRNGESVTISTQVVDYALEQDAEQVHGQINSAYSSTSDWQRIKVEALRLYPFKGK